LQKKHRIGNTPNNGKQNTKQTILNIDGKDTAIATEQATEHPRT
jgi:hypothetical protein